MLKAKEGQFPDAPLSTSVRILPACLIAAASPCSTQVALAGNMGLEVAAPIERPQEATEATSRPPLTKMPLLLNHPFRFECQMMFAWGKHV